MITYVCNKCRKAIPFDDIEAIEIQPPRSKMLFSKMPFGDEDWEVLKADVDVHKQFGNMSENIHLCGECKGDFYDFI